MAVILALETVVEWRFDMQYGQEWRKNHSRAADRQLPWMVEVVIATMLVAVQSKIEAITSTWWLLYTVMRGNGGSTSDDHDCWKVGCKEGNRGVTFWYLQWLWQLYHVTYRDGSVLNKIRATILSKAISQYLIGRIKSTIIPVMFLINKQKVSRLISQYDEAHYILWIHCCWNQVSQTLHLSVCPCRYFR